ncbi:hypothetical protein [Albibacterium indicum]|uniref:hypothetical protein n=1 Tax=Albibacterium indicum TaxID=2292082 RepID=UPI000E4AC75F|nr:hypothetical protein [Pedobacter indicus]
MWIAAAVGASVFGIYAWTRYRKSNLTKLVELNIGTENGYYYLIDARKKKPVVEPKEKIMLTLGLTAHVLSSLHRTKHPEKQHILNFLSSTTAENLSQAEINKYFRREFAFEISASLGKVKKKSIRINLYADAEGDLKVDYKEPISLVKYQFLFSVASFIMLILETLDINEQESLRKSLNYISKQYLSVKETLNGVSTDEMIKNAYAAGHEPETFLDIEIG